MTRTSVPAPSGRVHWISEGDVRVGAAQLHQSDAGAALGEGHGEEVAERLNPPPPPPPPPGVQFADGPGEGSSDPKMPRPMKTCSAGGALRPGATTGLPKPRPDTRTSTPPRVGKRREGGPPVASDVTLVTRGPK